MEEAAAAETRSAGHEGWSVGGGHREDMTAGLPSNWLLPVGGCSRSPALGMPRTAHRPTAGAHCKEAAWQREPHGFATIWTVCGTEPS